MRANHGKRSGNQTMEAVNNFNARPGAVRRELFFVAGDCTFLIVVGVMAVVAMQTARGLGWGELFGWVLGMLLAMAIQTALSLLVSPLLGSIEAMTPAMITAMAVPMIVDGAEMLGLDLSRGAARWLGVLLALAAFTLLQIYAASCKRRLAHLDDGA